MCLFSSATQIESCNERKLPQEEKVDKVSKELIEINFQETGAVSSNIFGFNTANYFFHQPSSIPSPDLKNLSPILLRFPGGTTANFYHFYGRGYGYKAEDVALVKGTNAYQNIMKGYKYQQKLLQKGKLKENYAKSFADLALSLNAKVNLVANLFTSDEQEILDMIAFFMKHKVIVEGVELGNEYYFKAYQKVFPDVGTYLKKAKSLAVQIKKRYPQLKIGIVAASSPELKAVVGPRKDFFNGWNQALAKEGFYDAVITHLYSKPKKCLKTEDQKASFDCAYEVNKAFISKDFPKVIEYYKSIYGNNVNLWITEWNMQGVFQRYGNTYLQALYAADFLLSISGNRHVDLACYHNLLSRGEGFSVLARNSGQVTKRASFYIQQLFAPIFQDEVKALAPANLPIAIAQNCEVKAYKKGEEVIIIVINKSSDSLVIEGFSGVSLGSSVLQKSISAPFLSSKSDEIKLSDQKISTTSSINVAPYSVNRFILR